MSFIGRPINLAVVAVVALLLAGTVGATVVYQSSASDLEAQNEQLRDRNEELRQELENARTELQILRERVADLNQSLQQTEGDVGQVASELESTERLLNQT